MEDCAMVTSCSAGILLFREGHGGLEVLLGHMGGPFWARRDAGAWSIPKGACEPGESALDAARREFGEELGLPPPAAEPIALGEVRQSGGKVVTAWAVRGDLDPSQVVPGTFELPWPPGSGHTQRFPEIDRAAWFDLDTAREKAVTGQRVLFDRLREHLAS